MSDADPDTARLRPDETSRWSVAIEWTILDGDRIVVAIGISLILFVAFGGLVVLGITALESVQPLYYVYSGLIAGNLTLITVVVSINQLLLSRELQTPGELREQIDNVIEYRQDVEEATDTLAPVQPLGFLQLLVEATRQEAQKLGGFARDGIVEEGAEELDEEVTGLTERMDAIDSVLDGSNRGTFSVLSVLLNTNNAREINRLRTVGHRYDDELPAPVHEGIDRVIDRLQKVDIARQYFKSIYLQQELSSLSQILLITGIPAVAVSIATLLLLTVPPDVPERVPSLRGLLPVSIAIGLLPLGILCSYILRTATVTKRTASTLPFTTPEQEQKQEP